MDLNLVRLIFSLTIDGSVNDRFALFGLNRRFPPELRRVTCGRSVPCGECRDTAGCPWFPLFGQALPADPEAVRRHQKPPLPFVFDIPLLIPGEVSGADAEMGLTLVGSAVNHAGLFIRAVERSCIGDGIAITVDGVASQGLFGERSVIGISKRGDLAGEIRILAAGDVAAGVSSGAGEVSVGFLTPYRQAREGRFCRSFDASAFLRGLVRRVSSLVATYGGGELDDDFRWLAAVSRDVDATDTAVTFDSGAGPSRAGLLGRVRLGGAIEPFLPYLHLGEYLHAGKGASWGFGRYELAAS